jgi:hypothetical protein
VSDAVTTAPSLFIVLNHRFSPAQEADARTSLGVARFVALPQELQHLWAQVPPDLPALLPYLAPLMSWLAAQTQPGDYLLIQGDFGATYLLARFALECGLTPIYATTWRQAKEEIQADGAVKLTHHFQHQAFRRYGV